MSKSQSEKRNDDILVIPSNKNQMNSNQTPITNQIREVLYNVDNDNNSKKYQQTLQQNQRLRRQLIMYKNQFQHINQREKKQKSQTPEDKNLLTKYKKALVQINNLLNINKQLKGELDNTRNRNMDKNKMRQEYETIVREKQQLSFLNHRLQSKIQQMENSISLYSNKLKQFQNSVKSERQQYENQLILLTNNYKNKQLELKEIKYKIQSKYSFNENQAEYKNMIDRLRNNQISYMNEIKNLHQHILELQNHLNQTKLQYEKQAERKNIELHEVTLKMRRQSQQQLFGFKSQNNNLKQLNLQLQRQKQKLTKQIQNVKQKSSEKQSQKQRFEHELNSQIENLKKEINRLKEIVAEKEQMANQINNLNREIKKLSLNNESIIVENKELKQKIKQLQSIISKLESVKKEQIKPIIKQSPQNLQILKENQQIINNLKSQNELLKKKILTSELEPLPIQNKIEQIVPVELSQINHKIKEFKLRIQTLLTDKQNTHISHSTLENYQQFLSMKVFIAQLDQKLKIVTNESLQYRKKIKYYKDKILEGKKRLENSFNQNKVLVTKINGYDKLVSKLQLELQKVLKINQILLKNKPNHTNVQNELKQYISDLNDRLVLQQKYFKQEIETKILEYESKLISQKIQLQQYKNVENSSEMQNLKMNELNQRVTFLENQLKYKIQQLQKIRFNTDNTIQNKLFNQYKNKINQNETYITKLQYQINQIKQNGDYLTKLLDQEKSNSLYNLRNKDQQIAHLEFTITKLQTNLDQTNKQNNKYSLDLQRKIEQLNKYRNLEMKLTSSNSELQYRNKQIERLNGQIRKIQDILTRCENEKNVLNTNSELKDRQITELYQSVQAKKKQIESLKNIISQNEQYYSKINQNFKNKQLFSQQQTYQFKEIQFQKNSLLEKLSKKQLQIQKLQRIIWQNQSSYSQKYEPLKYDIENLQNQLNESNEKKLIFSNQVKQKDLEIERLQKIISQKTNYIYETTYSVQEKDIQNQNIERTLNTLKQNLKQFKDQLNSKQIENQALRKQVSDNKYHVDRIISNVSLEKESLVRQISSIQENITILNQTIKQKQLINANLEKEIFRLQQAQNQHMQSIRNYEKNYYEIQLKYNQKVTNLQIKQKEYIRLQDFIKEHEQIFEKTTQQLRIREFEVQKLKKILKQNQQTYQQQNYERQNMISLYDRRINELSNQIQYIKSQNQRLLELENELFKQKMKNSSHQNQIQNLQLKITNLQAQLSKYNEADSKYRSIQQQNYELVHKFEYDLKNIEFQKQRLEKSNELHVKQIEDLYNELSKLRGQYNNKIFELNTKMSALQNELYDSKYNVNKTTSQLNYTINSLKQQNSYLNYDVNSLRTQLARLKQIEYKSYEKQKKLNELILSSEDLSFNHNFLQKQNEKLKITIKQYETRSQDLINKLSTAQSKLKNNQYQIYDLKVSLDKLQQLKYGNSALYAEIQRLQKIVQSLQKDLKILKLKYSGEIYQQNRIQENLGLFVLIFAEIEALRSQVKQKQLQLENMNQMRRSSLLGESRYI